MYLIEWKSLCVVGARDEGLIDLFLFKEYLLIQGMFVLLVVSVALTRLHLNFCAYVEGIVFLSVRWSVD